MSKLLEIIYQELGIEATHLASYKLEFCAEPPLDTLEVTDIDFEGRPFILDKQASVAWLNMCVAAKADGVILRPYSGFRSYLYQKQLIKRKLEKGKPLEIILTETAVPGFSEHHSGRAVDICADGVFDLSENFELTNAFVWLKKNALMFGFHLSYPRHNTKGIVYEPWHWCFRA